MILLGPRDARLTCLMIHGRGRDAAEMATLAGGLGAPDVRFLCPDAPGGSWYPGRFMDPPEANEPWLSEALARLEDLVSGLPHDRLVLAGFSQGACLAAQMLVRRPGRYGGALIFTGGLIGPPGTVWPPGDLAGTPVLLTGSDVDDWIPVARTRETAAALTARGAAVDLVIYPDRAHEVCADERTRAARFLAA